MLSASRSVNRVLLQRLSIPVCVALLLGRLVRLVSWHWLVKMALRPGFLNPASAQAVEPAASIPDGQGITYLLQQISRIDNGERMTQPSQVEGPITHEKWYYFQLRHAELHLSFQITVQATETSKQSEG